MNCHHCGNELVLLEDFETLYQVTSDCKPWKTNGELASCKSCGMIQKPVTNAWQEDVNQIYASYDIYSQSGGVEQAAFDQDSGASLTRSQKIVQWLAAQNILPERGKLLDIGCGNGSFLRAFGIHYPQWEMTGLELNDINKGVIEAIPGVKKLHIGSLETLQDTFDVVVLIHALEHIPHPSAFVKGIKNNITDRGILFIEVPDLNTSPFDILVADHSTHFVEDVLRNVIIAAGFDPVILEANFVPKELSLLARNVKEGNDKNKMSSNAPDPDMLLKGQQMAKSHINELNELLKNGRNIEGKVGIFGTAIAGTWLAASLGEKVAFFVDEDQNRIGRTHMGRPIYSPKDIPDRSAILVPLRTDIATAVRSRLIRLIQGS